MKNKLIIAAAVFSLGIILISGGLYLFSASENADSGKAQYIVDLNEIERLNLQGDYITANKKINILQENMREKEERENSYYAIPILCGASILFIAAAFGYIYFAILRPFEKMKDFASDISSGNLDVRLKAYTVALSANMDSSFEKRERYLSVINKKCDEVSRLTNDLFLHSVSDLDKLKLSPERIDICAFAEGV